MPKFLEQKLKSAAATKGLKGKRAAAYVYGTMNNMGAMHGNKETAKGAAMQAKHEDASAKNAKMRADISKYKGESAETSFRRPVRKTLRRHV